MGFSFWLFFVVQFILLILTFITVIKVENERPTNTISPKTDTES